MTVEALSSNVVNYLVWRYLQEAGYGNAALQLSRCWIRDPETLPFAKHVSHHTLINLLQDGLWFDKLQAEAGNGEQRYQFGRDHGQPYSVRNGNMLTLDQGIPAYQLAEEAGANGAIPEPAPRKGPGGKRKRKANGIEPRMNTQVNGDVMDIDQNGNTQVTNSVRAESEAAVSDAESPSVADIPISTLSIGQSTEIQTDKTTDLKDHSIFTSIDDPDKVVTQTLWGTPDSPLLLTAGKSLLRLHFIPKLPNLDNRVQRPTVHDLDLPLDNFSVTAVCWNSNTELTVSAQEEQRNEGGEIMKINKLVKIIDAGMAPPRVISSTAGFVTTLRYNDAKRLLLSISTDGVKGSIKVWRDEDEGNSIPTWSAFTDTAVLDGVWISESAFVICGVGVLQIYQVEDTLTIRRKFETRVTWEKVKYDPSSGVISALGLEGQTGYLGWIHPAKMTELQTQEYPDPYPSDLDFRPAPKHGSGTSDFAPLLATCSASGMVCVWDAQEPFKCLRRHPTVDGEQANQVAFSPDGSLLAAYGPFSVTVWDVDKGDVPVATWRAQDWDLDHWDPSTDGEFSLGWDPDGSRLSIALGNQIAVISIPR